MKKEFIHNLNVHVTAIDKLNWNNEGCSDVLRKYMADAFFKFQVFQLAVEELTKQHRFESKKDK